MYVQPITASSDNHSAAALRRALDTAYRLIPAATEAFSDSTDELIGMPAIASQVSRTSRPKPLPSEEHYNERIGFKASLADELIAATVKADNVVSTLLQALKCLSQVHHARHRHMRGRTGRHLPSGGVH